MASDAVTNLGLQRAIEILHIASWGVEDAAVIQAKLAEVQYFILGRGLDVSMGGE